jgi:hypothetical protein
MASSGGFQAQHQEERFNLNSYMQNLQAKLAEHN